MTHTRWPSDKDVTDWREFNRVIRPQGNLLRRLGNFPHAILVTGCQRSGTTILSRVITQSEGLVNFWFGPDDELDSALILSGYVYHKPSGRYCFQTTYINEEYSEYYGHKSGFKLIWVIRNPFSVVYSMLYNWRAEALEMLFGLCGRRCLRRFDALKYTLFGKKGLSRLRRACWIYNAKYNQLFALKRNLEQDQIMVVDYDELVSKPGVVLPAIYEYINVDYRPAYSARIHARSVDKRKRFPKRQTSTIRHLCEPSYRQARGLLTRI